jgi:hypothetical protein
MISSATLRIMMIYNFHGKKKETSNKSSETSASSNYEEMRKFCENQRKRDKGKTQSHVTLALLDVRELLD